MCMDNIQSGRTFRIGSKDKLVVEYALRDLNKPIGVAEWETKIFKELPKELESSLPTIEELEKELNEYEKEEKE